MSIYLWSKVLHLMCVMGWMATVFGLSLLLVNLADPRLEPSARTRFAALGRRVYRLGHHLFGWAVAFGLVLWLCVGIGGAWLHVKLVVVTLLLAHFTVSGRWIKRVDRGRPLPSAHVLSWHGLIPVLLLLVIVWLALSKPFAASPFAMNSGLGCFNPREESVT